MKLQLIVTIPFLILIFIACFKTSEQAEPALKDVFRDYFLIGGALNDDVVSGKDPQAAQIAIKHFNTITAENVMKWEIIHPHPDTFNFAPADRFVEFGIKHGMHIIGHTLVWHSQVPRSAFFDNKDNLLKRDEMLARMKHHIETVMKRYKGKIHGWDVVNEAFEDDGTLRRSLWTRTIGPDFIIKAFEYAQEADPSAELYYNDYSLDKPAKRDAVVKLVRELKAKNIRIDGVGIQGHWGMDYPIKEELDAFIDSIAACGVKVMVTEMDIDILPRSFDYMGADVNIRVELQDEVNPYVYGLPDSAQQKLTRRYVDLFEQLLSHKDKITRVTFWGVYDKTSWLNDWPIRGRTSYPLLFDRNYQPKPAFYAIINLVKQK